MVKASQAAVFAGGGEGGENAFHLSADGNFKTAPVTGARGDGKNGGRAFVVVRCRDFREIKNPPMTGRKGEEEGGWRKLQL